MIEQLSALATRPTAPVTGTTRTASPSAGAVAGGDFAALLSEAVTELGAKLRHAEAVSIGGVKGQVPMQDVVEAVMSAEHTLQAAIAIRDKVVASYLEISRMAI